MISYYEVLLWRLLDYKVILNISINRIYKNKIRYLDRMILTTDTHAKRMIDFKMIEHLCPDPVEGH